MQYAPAVVTIAQTIQLSLSPVFMLAGIAGILNLIAGRLARVIDRVRVLETLHPRSSGPEHDRLIWELRLLDRRMKVINLALFLCVTSAVFICCVVALLFVAVLVHLHIGNILALTFIASMVLLVAGLVAFMVEVSMSSRATQVRVELLEQR